MALNPLVVVLRYGGPDFENLERDTALTSRWDSLLS